MTSWAMPPGSSCPRGFLYARKRMPILRIGRNRQGGRGQAPAQLPRRSFGASMSTAMSSMKPDRERFRKMASLRPVNSFISELKRFLRCHVGVRTEYLGIYAAWIAFKSSARDDGIEERIDLLESYCFQTKASFKVKDRYRVG